jgi:membrane-associated phospholipid phosphatase
VSIEAETFGGRVRRDPLRRALALLWMSLWLATPSLAQDAAPGGPARLTLTGAAQHAAAVHALPTSLRELAAATAITDSIDRVEPLFTSRDAAIAGGFLVGVALLAPLDQAVARAAQDSVLQTHELLRDGADVFRWMGFPGVVIVSGGLYAGGLLAGSAPLADMGLHTTGAIVIAEAVTFAAKAVTGRARPKLDTGDPFDFGLLRGASHDDYQSFPSGHTTAAFAAAAALTSEISSHHPGATAWVATVMFGGATLMGVSRLYHNEHWASDVVAGAAIGSFAGWKVVRYAHGRPRSWVDRTLLPAVAVRGDGVTLAWTISGPR